MHPQSPIRRKNEARAAPEEGGLRFALSIQYAGDAYSGYQRQKNQNSVQEEIEKALHILLNEEVRIHAAGRTDTGVHALGQVIHFKIPTSAEMLGLSDQTTKKVTPQIDLNRFIYSLNSLLPKDISVIHGSPVPEDFHARFSCIGREYVYQVVNTPFRSAAHKNFYWLRDPLDTKAVETSIPCLLGERDFASFTKAEYKASGESTIRRIDEINVIHRAPLFFFITEAQGFSII